MVKIFSLVIVESIHKTFGPKSFGNVIIIKSQYKTWKFGFIIHLNLDDMSKSFGQYVEYTLATACSAEQL